MQRIGPISFCSRERGAKAEVLFYAAGEITQTVSQKEKEGQRDGRKKGRAREKGREEPVEKKRKGKEIREEELRKEMKREGRRENGERETMSLSAQVCVIPLLLAVLSLLGWPTGKSCEWHLS